jgi:hypothetical protein
MSNPMIPQGTLNRLRASVNYSGNGQAGNISQLNITAPYLNKEGITLTLEGESTLMLPALTGVVTSPEPYMMISCVINMLKTQNLAALYKAQMEATTLIGDFTVTPDAVTMPPYSILNAAIESVKEMKLNGEDAGFVVTLKGTYLLNANQWNY